MLKLLDIDSIDENLTIGRLNRMIRNLKTLVKIHRIYQCTISYEQYLVIFLKILKNDKFSRNLTLILFAIKFWIVFEPLHRFANILNVLYSLI